MLLARLSAFFPLRVLVKRGGVNKRRIKKWKEERERDLGTAFPLLTFCRIFCSQPMGEGVVEKRFVGGPVVAKIKECYPILCRSKLDHIVCVCCPIFERKNCCFTDTAGLLVSEKNWSVWDTNLRGCLSDYTEKMTWFVFMNEVHCSRFYSRGCCCYL